MREWLSPSARASSVNLAFFIFTLMAAFYLRTTRACCQPFDRTDRDEKEYDVLFEKRREQGYENREGQGINDADYAHHYHVGLSVEVVAGDGSVGNNGDF